MSFLTVDASFISLRLLLPALVPLLTPQAEAILLIKPQFEVGKGEVGKGGVVRDAKQHRQVLQAVLTAAQARGLGLRAAIPSPLAGPKGNREFLAHLTAARCYDAAGGGGVVCAVDAQCHLRFNQPSDSRQFR